jgi:hypothetical protein
MSTSLDLRVALIKNNINLSWTSLSAAVSANAVQAAPVGLAVTISTAAGYCSMSEQSDQSERDYSECRSETAFAEPVRLQVDFVDSAALCRP